VRRAPPKQWIYIQKRCYILVVGQLEGNRQDSQDEQDKEQDESITSYFFIM
jgi:hypothetical protein